MMAPSRNTAMYDFGLQGMRQVTSSPMQAPPDMPKPLRIPDTRKVDGVTGNPVMDTNNLSRNADVGVMTKIIRAAKQSKVDPYTALALAHQETGLSGEEDASWNPFHLLNNKDPDLVASGVKFLKDKMDYAKRLGKTNEPDVIQAFNGYGKVGQHTEGKQKMMYGIDVSKQPIDMNQNPVYGKRIIDIRDNILKKNPDIVKLVSETN